MSHVRGPTTSPYTTALFTSSDLHVADLDVSFVAKAGHPCAFLGRASLDNNGRHGYRATATFQGDTLTLQAIRLRNNDGVYSGYTVLASAARTAACSPSCPAPSVYYKAFNLRLVVSGNDPVRMRVKAWLVAESEPASWTIDVQDADASRVTGAGYFGVSTYTNYITRTASITWGAPTD